MPPTRETSAVVAGRRLSFVATDGDGPTVLLLHGFGADRLTWLLTQRAISEYASTIALDLPGHGRSDRDVGEGTVTALSDLVAGFLDGRGTGPVHIVGHSLGGAIALDLAHRRPDLVASLFLLAPAGIGGGIDPAFLSAVVAMETLDAASAVLGRLVIRQRLISPQMTTRVLAQMAQPGVRDALRVVADGLADLHNRFGDRLDAIGAAGIPIRVLWGDGDTINPLTPACAEALAVWLEVIDDTGHLPHIESPAEVNQAIRSFIEAAARAQ
ncbi:alpha/beta fold hydrolase [Bauldia sp.]|uniref:alpha/beta fold hydrolase n=1 Tax=Bauldia sp. TaxID=2575872 RepID=UPI003BAA9A88